ncbi:MAG: glycosyltransferase family 39 protein [Candidatus Thorarchaeota archaeon]
MTTNTNEILNETSGANKSSENEEIKETFSIRTPDEKQFFKKIFNYLPLTIIIVISLLLRLFAAQEAQGFIHPDEVFQSIEMVHYWIYGEYGTGQTIPWEYNLIYQNGGARSWFFAFVLVGIYKTAMAFGIYDPIVHIYLARLFLSLFSIITVVVAYKFGKEAFNKNVGLLSAFICGIWWFFPFWASRTMTDSISSDFLILSIYLIYRTNKITNFKKKIFYSISAGFLVGLAFIVRFPSALMGFPLAFTLIFIAIREFLQMKKTGKVTKKQILQLSSPLLFFCLGAFVMVLFQGFLDLFTWGSFLHSPINFFEYNIIEGNSARHGTSPWYQYFVGFYTDYASYFLLIFLVLFILGIIFKEKVKTKTYMLIIIFYWIIIFSALAHKEFRFIMTILPLTIILISNGVNQIIKLFQNKKLRYSITALFLMVFIASSSYIAFYEKYWWWKNNSGICNAMYFVGKQEDAKYLVVCETVWYTGGYAYLDKNITCDFIRILFYNPYQKLNSSYYLSLYQEPGTYIIVRATEIEITRMYPMDIREFLMSQGLSIVSFIGKYPYVYVFKNMNI